MGIGPVTLSSRHVNSDSNTQKTMLHCIFCYALWIWNSSQLLSHLKKNRSGGEKKGQAFIYFRYLWTDPLRIVFQSVMKLDFLLKVNMSEPVLNLGIKEKAKVFHFLWLVSNKPSFITLFKLSSPSILFSSFQLTDALAAAQTVLHHPPIPLFSALTSDQPRLAGFLKRWQLSSTYLPELLIERK